VLLVSAGEESTIAGGWAFLMCYVAWQGIYFVSSVNMLLLWLWLFK
jgi:hypothetical protein